MNLWHQGTKLNAIQGPIILAEVHPLGNILSSCAQAVTNFSARDANDFRRERSTRTVWFYEEQLYFCYFLICIVRLHFCSLLLSYVHSPFPTVCEATTTRGWHMVYAKYNECNETTAQDTQPMAIYGLTQSKCNIDMYIYIFISYSSIFCY